ncbi:uncharacterized protein LOC110928405 [Helianthus annuus]|uniref:uncharacterized protein LOC110928405 n=1 Tax=Helianthus annuus TaxID=4232 RepID=UPI000B8F479C|nr:uncharacterized protein LOC110928405 [Helianthus annuus]
MDLKEEPLGQCSYMWDMNEEPVDNIPYSSFQSFYMHPLMEEIPKIFHPYVIHIEDVVGDGNCGFRAIAACLGYGEDQWLYVKEQLLHELLDAYIGNETVLTSGINEVNLSLLFSQSPAPRQHWMVMPETGILIANKFGVVLNCLSNEGCITCFSIWKGPEHFQHHKTITIAHVYGNHYVMVQLEREYPMPRISAYWIRYRAPSAVGWQHMYTQRLQLYEQLNPCDRDNAFIHIEESC